MNQSDKQNTAFHPHSEHHDACCAMDTKTGHPTAVNQDIAPPEGARCARYRIDKIDCPTEERLIRNRLEPMAGIVGLDFNLLDRELTVHHQLDDIQAITTALDSLDMAPSLLGASTPSSPISPALATRQKWLLAIAGAAAISAEVVA